MKDDTEYAPPGAAASAGVKPMPAGDAPPPPSSSSPVTVQGMAATIERLQATNADLLRQLQDLKRRGPDVAPARPLERGDDSYRLLFDAISEGFCIIEVLFDGARSIDYRFLQVNTAFEQQTGLTEAVGRTMRELAPDHEQSWFDIYGRVARTGEPARFEQGAAALNRLYDVFAFRVGLPEQRRVGVLFRDTLSSKLSEAAMLASEARLRDSEAQLKTLVQHQDVLLAELQHRVRNILTVVRSVFTQTVETGADLADITDHFRGRLDALARTQVVVTRSASGTVDLDGLVRDELLSVGAADHPQVHIEGPEVRLPSRAAESIGLAVHELTTNALKYGALHEPTATLDIHWTVAATPDGRQRLEFAWREQGSPALPAWPSHEGFGRRLIEEALPYQLGAETRLTFKDGEIDCWIAVPLPGEAAPSAPPTAAPGAP